VSQVRKETFEKIQFTSSGRQLERCSICLRERCISYRRQICWTAV